MKKPLIIGLVNTTNKLESEISKIIDNCSETEIVFHAEKIADIDLYLNKHKPNLLIVYSDFPQKGNLKKLLNINEDVDILMILKSGKTTFFPTRYLTMDLLSDFEVNSMLCLALECIANGMNVYGGKIKARLKKYRGGFSCPSDYDISERECEVLNSWLPLMKYKNVAHELGISVNTVRGHLKRIAKKLGLKSKDEIVGLLRENHWADFETGQVFFI
jgi:DNA-binding CsgD family transcriptional regulator